MILAGSQRLQVVNELWSGPQSKRIAFQAVGATGRERVRVCAGEITKERLEYARSGIPNFSF